MPPITNVLVTGATGFLGSRVVEALVRSGFTVSILSRDAKKGLPNAKTIVTDYSATSLRDAIRGHQAVVSTVGALGVLSQISVIDAAVEMGVQRYIPSDYAFNTNDLSAMEKALPPLYARLKPRQDVLRYLMQKAESNPSFSWTAIGSGPLLDWGLKTGAHEMIISKRSAVITDSGNEPYFVTSADQIARAICRSLIRTEETANRYLLVKSFITTQNETVAALEKLTGSTWSKTYVTSEQRKHDGLNLLSLGNPAGLGNLWNVWFNTDGQGMTPSEDGFANALLGLPEEDINTLISNVI